MPRFHKIHLDVEEVAVGPVMRLLHTTPGVVNIHYDVDEIGYKQIKKPNGAAPHGNAGKRRRSRHYGIKGSELILQLLSKNETLRTSQLEDAFVKAGRGRGVASAVYELKSAGLVETTPAGYVLTRKAKDRLRHRKGA